MHEQYFISISLFKMQFLCIKSNCKSYPVILQFLVGESSIKNVINDGVYKVHIKVNVGVCKRVVYKV